MHFIRLMRPTNLIIIAATMYSLGWYFDSIFTLDYREGHINSMDFFLLVLSTVIIAAGGNIINDYFDIKADRVNRPERLIITKHIKPRVAILTHWIFNFVAFSIAVYLSYAFNTFWYLFIHLLSINLLWIYSMRLKRTLYFGNIIIGFLTAMVPLLVGIFYHQSLDFTLSAISPEKVDVYPFRVLDPHNYILWLSFGLGGFAFLLNWAREIVKDMEDVDGDKKLRAKTIPIVLGYKRAKQIATLLLLVTVLGSLGFLVFSDALIDHWIAFIPAGLSALFWLVSLHQLIRSKTPEDYRIAHKTIKLIMICGLVLPAYWVVVIILQ
jgi:4-hydroxybenzoate polyprenyltransferase